MTIRISGAAMAEVTNLAKANSDPTSNTLSSMQSQNISAPSAPSAFSLNQQSVGNILINKLKELSPQEVNSLYETAIDGRVNVYSNVRDIDSEPYTIFIDRVTKRVNMGLSEGESIDEMNTLLDKVSQGAVRAHTETREILSDDIYEKYFTLQVKTREGDEIDIRINQGYKLDSVKVSYEVKGSLSDDEQAALNQLTEAIGSTSDDLLAGKEFTQLMGLNAFNGEELSSFNLRLQGNNQDIKYSYKHNGEDQQLSGSWKQFGQVKAKFSFNSDLGGLADYESLTQYIELIEQATRDSTKFNADKTETSQIGGF